MARPVATARMPTSATCDKTSRGGAHGRRRPCRPAAGFTLVELLVVLAVAALLIGVLPFAVSRFQDAAEYRNTVRQIIAEMVAARQRAIAQGRDVVFRVDLDGRRYGHDEQLKHRVPEVLELRARVAESEFGADKVAGIRFLPQGGATGGSIDILRPGGGGVRVSADWLFGRISQEALP